MVEAKSTLQMTTVVVAALASTLAGCAKDRSVPVMSAAPESLAKAAGKPCPPSMALIPGSGDDPVLDPMCMSVLETTVAEYRRCVDAGACKDPPGPTDALDTYRASGRDDNPVIGVRVADAAAYCSFIGARLPTVTEWRWAFHSGRPAHYPWGDEDGAELRICRPKDGDIRSGVGWPCPVGSHPADRTVQGLLDMGGNAVELSTLDGDEAAGTDWVGWGHLPLHAKHGPADDIVLSLPIQGRENRTALGFRCAADARGVPRPPKPVPKPDRVYDECPAGMVEVPGRPEPPPLGRFCIGETEVTVGQFRACVGASSCEPPRRGESEHATWRMDDPELPINDVEFDQASQYCSFIGARLPRLEEWLWAYGSAQGWPLPWGDDLPIDVDVCAAKMSSRHPRPCPVKSSAIDRTAQGVYGMAGGLDELVLAEHEERPRQVVSVRPARRTPGDVVTPELIRERYAPRWDAALFADRYEGFRCAATLSPRAGAAG